MAELKFKEFIETPGGSDFSGVPLDMLPLTMSYIPMQKFGSLYGEQEALKAGTIFCDLDKPFRGKFTGGREE